MDAWSRPDCGWWAPGAQGNFGPGAGQKRRPSVVSSRADDEDDGPNHFQMMSTAQVGPPWMSPPMPSGTAGFSRETHRGMTGRPQGMHQNVLG